MELLLAYLGQSSELMKAGRTLHDLSGLVHTTISWYNFGIGFYKGSNFEFKNSSKTKTSQIVKNDRLPRSKVPEITKKSLDSP